MALPWIEPDYRDGANGRRWMVRTGDVWETFEEFAAAHGTRRLNELLIERGRSLDAEAAALRRDADSLLEIRAKLAFHRFVDDYRPGVLG